MTKYRPRQAQLGGGRGGQYGGDRGRSAPFRGGGRGSRGRFGSRGRGRGRDMHLNAAEDEYDEYEEYEYDNSAEVREADDGNTQPTS